MVRGRTWIGLAGSLLITIVCGPLRAAPPIAWTTLPLSLTDNRPFVSVHIDGKGPFSFLLDTGASSTTLSADLAKSLRLPAISSSAGSGAGEQRVHFQIVHVAKLTVGPFSIGSLDAPAIDTTELSRVIGFEHFDGVLGVEIFRQHVVTINAAQAQLPIMADSQFKPLAGAVAVPFTLDENEMPIVTASVAGVTGSFQIDTGGRSSLTLFGPFWRLHRLDQAITPTVTAMTGYGIGGPILGIVGRSDNLSIDSLSVSRPVIRLSLQENGSFTRRDRAGSIGMGILKRFTVSFDYPHHTMWLSKAPVSGARNFPRLGGRKFPTCVVLLTSARWGAARQ